MADRAIVSRLRAEVGQYLDSMKKAADATGKVGDEGQKAADKLQKALSRQEASAKSLEAAEARLAAAKKSTSTSTSALAAAEAGVIRARQADVDATNSLTTALASAREESTRSTTRLGSLAEVAQRNEQAWTRAGSVLTGVGVGITALGVSAAKAGIDYNTLQQTSRAALTSLLGSAQAANAQMDRLDDFARTSPFSKSTFISAQQQMLAFGIEAQKVVPYLDAIQNAVAASGGSNDDIAGIVATMSKVQSSAKITAEDLNELGNRGVNAAELIGSQMGMTGAEVREAITKGTLDAGQALDALAAGMSDRFDGAADNVKNTFAGALDRVKAAWRDLGSALAEPLVGKNGGGALTGLLNELADAMRAIEDLPGPAKAAAVGITGLAGVGSLAAGGFLLLAPRIVETRAALETLSTDLPRTTRAMSALSKALGTASLAFIAYEAAGAATTKFDVASVEDFTGALLDGSDAIDKLFRAQATTSKVSFGSVVGGVTELSDGISGVADAFDKLDSSGLGRAVDMFTPWEDGFDKAAKAVGRTDEALAGLVRSGNAEEAKRLAEEVARQAGRPVDEVLKRLPQYADALKAVENEQRLAGDSATSMGKAVALSADDLKSAQDALKSAEENATATAESFVNLGDSLNDPKVSLQDWIGELEKQSKALADFQKNAAKATSRGLDQGLVQELEGQGAAGAMRLEQLADASEQELDRINEAWREGQDAISDYVESQNLVAPEILTEFQASGTEGAIQKALDVAAKYNLTPEQIETALRAINYTDDEIDTVQRRLRDLNGESATVGLFASGNALSQMQAVANLASGLATMNPILIGLGVSGSNAVGGFYDEGVRAYADGGIDARGRSVPRIPQMRSGTQGTVMWGEPETGWEAYISGKPGMEDRNRGIVALAAGRLGMEVTKYADGGFTDAADKLETLRMRIRVRDLQRSLREMEEYGEPDKKTKKRKKRLRLRGMDRVEAKYELAEARQEFAATLRANSAARRRGMGPERYNEYRQNQIDRRRELAQDRKSAADSYLGNADIGSLSTPEQVERSLERSITDMATLTSLLIDLKKKGAAPWLLQQLQSAGPSKGAIRLARRYLTDSKALASVNAQAKQLQQVSNIYGQVTADPKWMSAGASSSSLTASQSRQLQLIVQTSDKSTIAEVVRQVVVHEVMPMLGTGAGV